MDVLDRAQRISPIVMAVALLAMILIGGALANTVAYAWALAAVFPMLSDG